jgi:2-furoyl-CoA dehydrogenase large subunit
MSPVVDMSGIKIASDWVGCSVPRVEDTALLAGSGRFADDMPVPPGTLHAAILRSPYPHAKIGAIDASAALVLPGVAAVVTGAEVRHWTRPFTVGVKQPMEHWCLAVDRVRYVGEPVAVVLAADRYRAEDALERIAVQYEALQAVVDPHCAAQPDAPLLHQAVGSNVVSERRFSYGDPDAAFRAAATRQSRPRWEGRAPRLSLFALTPRSCSAGSVAELVARRRPMASHFSC